MRNNKRTSKVRRFGRRDTRRRFLMLGLPMLLVGALATTYILKASAITAIDASYEIDLSSINKNAIPNGAQVWVYFASDGCGVMDYGDRYDQEHNKYYNYITDKTPINSASSDEITKSVKLAPGKYCVIYTVRQVRRRNSSSVRTYYNDSYLEKYEEPEVKKRVYEYQYDEDEIYTDERLESTILVNVNGDGSIVDEDGNPFSVKIKEYSGNKIKIKYNLSSYKNAEIPEGEKLVVKLRETNSYYTEYDTNIAAIGEANITETGTGDVELSGLDRSSEFAIRYGIYCVSWEVRDSSGAIDPRWTNQKTCTVPDKFVLNDRIYFSYGDDYSSGEYHYNPNWLFKDLQESVIESVYRSNVSSDFVNATSSENGKNPSIDMHTISSSSDIKDGAHYMIVAKNENNGSYYALSVNGNIHATKITDFNEDSIDSYKISKDTLKNSDYIYTARSTEIDGNRANVKFLSNIISNNRYIALKLGNSPFTYDDMFNDIGGAQVVVQKSDVNDKAYFVRKNNRYLSLLDYYGHSSFEIRQRFGTEYKLNETFMNTNSGATYGQRTNMGFALSRLGSNVDIRYLDVNKCDVYVTKTPGGYNNKACYFDTDDPDYYSSADYKEKWDQQYDSGISLYILTDAEVGVDIEKERQLLEATYYPVENIADSENYKNQYNSNFLLTYVDENGNNHLLSASNIIKGESLDYYPGVSATVNQNNTITTQIRNSFSYSGEEDIKAESTGVLKLHGIKQQDESNSAPYIMIDGNDSGNYISYSKSRKEMSFYFNEDDTVYIRGSKSDRWIGWGEIADEDGEKHDGFISVSSKADAIKFKIYSIYHASGKPFASINVFDQNGEIEKSYGFTEEYLSRANSSEYIPYSIVKYEYYNGPRFVNIPSWSLGTYMGSGNDLSNRIPLEKKIGDVDEDGNVFAGYTLNEANAGIIDVGEDAENAYSQKDGLCDEFLHKYNIATAKSYIDPQSILTYYDEPKTVMHEMGAEEQVSAHADLYPVYIKHATSKAALIKDPDIKALIGATDWKDGQTLVSSPATATNNAITNAINGTNEEKDTQVWQGSINVETYVDGKLYGTPDKLYFQYHNDDAADVIIKFIDDSKLAAQVGDDTNAKLQKYLLNESILPATSQDGKYTIDAVIAEQAGSEDGLKYAYNWVNESGARLDNVKGGSTIKVYMSNKYQVKYYLDDEELTGGTYQDSNYYASGATARAIEAEEAAINMDSSITDEQMRGLMDKNITEVGDSEVYEPANSKRFDFEAYKYLVHERDNKFTAAAAPTIPEGLRFKSARWQIKDDSGNIIAEVSPEELAAISEQEGGLEQYFDALTQYAYAGEGDNVNTFHLYLYTEEDTNSNNPTNPAKPQDAQNPQQSKNPFTSAASPAIYCMLTGALIAALGLAAYKKCH